MCSLISFSFYANDLVTKYKNRGIENMFLCLIKNVIYREKFHL